MPTFAVIAALPLLLAPASTDRGAATVEVSAAAEAEPPESADPPPTPAAVAEPAPMPMPVPVAPPPPVRDYGVAPPPADPPPARTRERDRTWPDRPIGWRVDLMGHLGNIFPGDTAWRAFDHDRRAFQLGATVRGDFRLGDGRVFLGGGLTFQRFGGHGSIYNTLSTDIRVREPLAFLRLSVVTIEGVDVFVQAGGGPSLVDLTVNSVQSGEQRAVGAVVDGLAGLAVYLPKKWLPRRGSSRVTGGLELAAGYSWRSKFDVRPTLFTDEDPIDTTAASLGDLSLRGATWRLGLFVRFQ